MMQYEDFSRHLREKYATRLHVADQLADRLKQKSCTSNQNEKVDENQKICRPYFNECIRAAERVKNNRTSMRDRQICYENLILAQKLERIKNPEIVKTRKYLETFEQNQFRTSERTKVNVQKDLMKLMRKEFITKQFLLSNTQESNSCEEQLFETARTSCHSPLSIQRENEVSSSEDDQATAADVDHSMNSCDSISLVAYKNYKRQKPLKNQKSKWIEFENVGTYQHLNKIDLTMTRDTMLRANISECSKKHFSVCILPRQDSNKITSTKINEQCAFKKEILYYPFF